MNEIELEYFLNWIDFNFDGVLDDTQEEKLEKRLAYDYNNDFKSFESFYDDFVELGNDVSDDLKKQIKELLDKVSKVEYGKQGHPKLDLESMANKYYDDYFLEN